MNQMHTIPYAAPFYNCYRSSNHAYANLAYLSRLIIKISFPRIGSFNHWTLRGKPAQPTTIAYVFVSEGFSL